MKKEDKDQSRAIIRKDDGLYVEWISPTGSVLERKRCEGGLRAVAGYLNGELKARGAKAYLRLLLGSNDKEIPETLITRGPLGEVLAGITPEFTDISEAYEALMQNIYQHLAASDIKCAMITSIDSQSSVRSQILYNPCATTSTADLFGLFAGSRKAMQGFTEQLIPNQEESDE